MFIVEVFRGSILFLVLLEEVRAVTATFYTGGGFLCDAYVMESWSTFL